MKPSFFVLALLGVASCASDPPDSPPVPAPVLQATDIRDRSSESRHMDDRWVGVTLYRSAGPSLSIDVFFTVDDSEDVELDDFDVELMAGEEPLLLVDRPSSYAVTSTITGGGTGHATFGFHPGTTEVTEIVVHFRGATERFLVADMPVAPWA